MCDGRLAVSNRTSGSNPARPQVCSAPGRFARVRRQTGVLLGRYRFSHRSSSGDASIASRLHSSTVATSPIYPHEASINLGNCSGKIDGHSDPTLRKCEISGDVTFPPGHVSPIRYRGNGFSRWSRDEGIPRDGRSRQRIGRSVRANILSENPRSGVKPI